MNGNPQDEPEGALHTIGEVAALSGVPVKTIRHYSDLGVLPPSRVTEAGYRLYSDADRVRLELIRTLRAIGLDLPTIRRLLRDELPVREVVGLHLDAIEVELRALQRQRVVLRAVAQAGEAGTLAYLERMQTLARLDQRERERFLADHLERGLADLPLDPAWKEWFFRGAALELPEEMSAAQLAAWLELAELIADPDFLRRQKEQARPFWESVPEGIDFTAWREALDRLVRAAAAAAAEGLPPDGEAGQRLAGELVDLQGRAVGREGEPGLAAWLVEKFDEGYDPRAERYWELIGILKGWPAANPVARAWRWLVAGLRARAARDTVAR